MPLAVFVAAWVTFRPDARFTWILALPFLVLAMMFTMNYDSIHLVAWYGGEELPLRYRFAATWAAREGPILLWVAWMALLSIVWRKPLQEESPLQQGEVNSILMSFRDISIRLDRLEHVLIN